MNHEEFLKFLGSEARPKCGRCWWREGRKCYNENLGAVPGEGQDITAELWATCSATPAYQNSRATLAQALPNILLAVAAQTQPAEKVVQCCEAVESAYDSHDTAGQKGTES